MSFINTHIKKIMEVFFIRKNELPMNEEIRDREVRLINDDGVMLGVMSSMDAQKLAIEKNLDLVKIVPNAVPTGMQNHGLWQMYV